MFESSEVLIRPENYTDENVMTSDERVRLNDQLIHSYNKETIKQFESIGDQIEEEIQGSDPSYDKEEF